MQQSNWVITILDTISRLSSIYIHIGPDLIRYTLTTINYPSCQQISVSYNMRVQNYLQRIYLQQSNWVIFDHFGHYFQIIFNLYSYWTRFNSIYINYNILLSILLSHNKFQSYAVITHECNIYSYWTRFIYTLTTINYKVNKLVSYTSAIIQIGSFLTILDTISTLTAIYIHFAI